MSVHTAISPLIVGPQIENYPMVFSDVNLYSGLICAGLFVILCFTDYLRIRFLDNKHGHDQEASSDPASKRSSTIEALKYEQESIDSIDKQISEMKV